MSCFLVSVFNILIVVLLWVVRIFLSLYDELLGMFLIRLVSLMILIGNFSCVIVDIVFSMVVVLVILYFMVFMLLLVLSDRLLLLNVIFLLIRFSMGALLLVLVYCSTIMCGGRMFLCAIVSIVCICFVWSCCLLKMLYFILYLFVSCCACLVRFFGKISWGG